MRCWEAQIHTITKCGVAHFKSSNEEECIQEIKKLVSFLPDNNLTDVPTYQSEDDLNRLADELNDIIPDNANKPYDMLDIIEKMVDNGDFLEIQKHFAQNIVIGFGRLNGSTVGILGKPTEDYGRCTWMSILPIKVQGLSGSVMPLTFQLLHLPMFRITYQESDRNTTV